MQRSEDNIIAYTWRKFIDEKGANPFWLAHLPMTKGEFFFSTLCVSFKLVLLGSCSSTFLNFEFYTEKISCCGDDGHSAKHHRFQSGEICGSWSFQERMDFLAGRDSGQESHCNHSHCHSCA